jgi:hypothetical protein
VTSAHAEEARYRALSLWWDSLDGPVIALHSKMMRRRCRGHRRGVHGLVDHAVALDRRPVHTGRAARSRGRWFGASGRDGGWCSALFATSDARVAGVHGVDRARAMRHTMQETIDVVANAASAEGIDCHLAKGARSWRPAPPPKSCGPQRGGPRCSWASVASPVCTRPRARGWSNSSPSSLRSDHPSVGRSARGAARLALELRARPDLWCGMGRRVRGRRRVDRQWRGQHARRPHLGTRERPGPAAVSRPPLSTLGTQAPALARDQRRAVSDRRRGSHRAAHRASFSTGCPAGPPPRALTI